MNCEEIFGLAIVAFSATVCICGIVRSFFREDYEPHDWTKGVR